MGIDEFVAELAEAIEVDPETLGPETRFDSLERWDSLAALSAIVMVSVDYDVEVSGDELVACARVRDLHALVTDKMANASS